jgi:uncharacterized protein (TIGR02145 family)
MIIRRGGLVLLSTLLATSFVSLNTFADETASSTFSINVSDTVLQLEVPATASINLNPTSSAAVFGSTTITANVATNNALGYTLTMTPTNSAGNTDLISSTVSSSIQTLSSSEEGYTEQSFTANKWGYRLSSNENYFGVPPTLAPDAWVTNGPTNGTDHNITLAAKVDGTFPASEYTTTLVFSAVARELITPDKLGITYLQDLTPELCDLIDVYDESSAYQLKDKRDEKTYWIAKLHDNHCWMTQNLDFDLDSTVTLTNAMSDIGWYGAGYDSASWQPNKTTYHLATGTGNAFVDDFEPYSYDPGDYYQQGTYWEPSAACSYATDDTCTFSSTPDSINGTHGHIGNYYTYSAAVASNDGRIYTTNTAIDSICPTNWRLPNKIEDNDYTAINTLYNNSSTTTDRGLFEAPFYLVRGGYASTSGYASAGQLTDYVTSSSYSAQQPWQVFNTPGGVNTSASSMPKYNGFSVRCLTRTRDPDLLTKYVISFNANGGTGTMPDQEVTRGTTVALSPNTFTRDGYYFRGWNTKADDTGEGFTDKGNYTVANISKLPGITLYAQWTTNAPICTENCSGNNPKYESGITIQRAYELAYTEHHLGMYEEQHEGQGDYARVDSWGTPAEEYKGYDVRFAMQDINQTYNGIKVCDLVTVIGDTYQALDVRDNKLYFISKLKDGKCWMTQNLDYDLLTTRSLTSVDSDLTEYGTDWYTPYYSQDANTGVISWTPTIATVYTTESNYNTPITGWGRAYTVPMSASIGVFYQYTSPTPNDVYTKDLKNCIKNTNTVDPKSTCIHHEDGNFYNWPAAIATSTFTSQTEHFSSDLVAQNSVCPANWKLPNANKTYTQAALDEYDNLLYVYGMVSELQTENNKTAMFVNGRDDFEKLRSAPLYFTQSGMIESASGYGNRGNCGFYWGNTSYGVGSSSGSTSAFEFGFCYSGSYNYSAYTMSHGSASANGHSIRCLAR